MTDHQVSLDKLNNSIALAHFSLDDYIIQSYNGRHVAMNARDQIKESKRTKDMPGPKFFEF